MNILSCNLISCVHSFWFRFAWIELGKEHAAKSHFPRSIRMKWTPTNRIPINDFCDCKWMWMDEIGFGTLVTMIIERHLSKLPDEMIMAIWHCTWNCTFGFYGRTFYGISLCESRDFEVYFIWNGFQFIDSKTLFNLDWAKKKKNMREPKILSKF